MPVVDKQIGLRVYREFTKRNSLDCRLLNVFVSSGVVHVGGQLDTIKGETPVNVEHELEILQRTLRTIPGVREVVFELDKRRI